MTHKNISGNEIFGYLAVNVALIKAPSPSGRDRNYMCGEL